MVEIVGINWFLIDVSNWLIIDPYRRRRPPEPGQGLGLGDLAEAVEEEVEPGALGKDQVIPQSETLVGGVGQQEEGAE